MKFWRAILLIPAPAVTLVGILSFIPPGDQRTFGGDNWFVKVAEPTPLEIVIFSALFAMWILWPWALYRVSSHRQNLSTRFGDTAFRIASFSAPLPLAVGAALYHWPGEPPAVLVMAFTAIGLVFGASFYSGWFVAARRFLAYSSPGAEKNGLRVYWMLVVLAALPISIWFMQNRLYRLAEDIPTESST